MSKVVTINSKENRYVYGTSYTENVIDSNGNQRMNLNPTTWLNTRILIKAGIFDYPAEIKDWDSVKSLEKSKLLTISEEHDGSSLDEDTNAIAATELAEEKKTAEKEVVEKKKRKAKKLEELAEAQLDSELEKLI